MRFAVLSDTHGDLSRMFAAADYIRALKPDALIHLGDFCADAEAMAKELRLELHAVAGNCDAGYTDPAEGMAPFAGVLFFYTHGHHYGVKMGTDRLAESAGERGADVALFGHTHRRALVRGVGTAATVFNPGSLRDGGSYGVITVTDGECQFGWKRVPEF